MANDNCPVAATLDLIGGKYKALILWHLADGKLRFSELRKIVKNAFAITKAPLENLPAEILEKHRFPTRKTALINIHYSLNLL